ncbi:hypothetical protein CEXT_426611 [Caerostris extrusa]|uniref:Uncharacterized protein n=1 Tax=Caerostris extrusa TaxID=172846 RepID=A0AAV4Y2L9_CAEEX|nr:hypothetical protein CEXT_426611 [Caerostris extrusa]
MRGINYRMGGGGGGGRFPVFSAIRHARAILKRLNLNVKLIFEFVNDNKREHQYIGVISERAKCKRLELSMELFYELLGEIQEENPGLTFSAAFLCNLEETPDRFMMELVARANGSVAFDRRKVLTREDLKHILQVQGAPNFISESL